MSDLEHLTSGLYPGLGIGLRISALRSVCVSTSRRIEVKRR